MSKKNRGGLHFTAGIDNSKLASDAERSKNILRGIGDTAKKEGVKIDTTVKQIGVAVASIATVSKLKEWAKEVVNVRGQFQQLEIAFKNILGSKEKADALMSQLIKTAATTPFNMSDIANSAKQLLAYGVAGEEVNETLIRLGDIAAGLSIPLNDLAYLYGTTMVQGRLYTMDLNQFLGRGIPLTDELAKQFGVAKDQVKKLVEEGKVGFPEVKKAIVSLTSEGGKFGGLMEAQSKSIAGQIANIEDAIEQMFNELGKESEGVISDTLSGVSKAIEHWKEIGKVILVVITAYGAYKGAILAVWAAKKLMNIAGNISAFLSLTRSITSAKDAMLLFNMATKANPLGLVLGIISSVIAAFSLFSNKAGEATETIEKYGESATKQINRINTLTRTLAGLTAGTDTHKKVTDELNTILKEYGITQVQEGENIDEVNKKREKAISLIKQEALERQKANSLNSIEEDYTKGVKEAKDKLFAYIKDTHGSLSIEYGNKLHKELEVSGSIATEIITHSVEQNIHKIVGKVGSEYEKGYADIAIKIRDSIKKAGFSNLAVEEFNLLNTRAHNKNALKLYIRSMKELAEQKQEVTKRTEKWIEAEKKAELANTTFAEGVEATKTKIQGASDDVYTLYKNLKSLMSQYSDNTIGFNVKFRTDTPKWMEKLSVDELRKKAILFSSSGAEIAKRGLENLPIEGQSYTAQEALQLGADFATVAERKQKAKDKADKELRDKADEIKKEREKIAEQTAERIQAIKEYGEKVKEQTAQTELEIRQQRIDLLEDGFDKQRELIELNYDRLIAQNAQKERQMIEELANNKVNEWLNKHPKATKAQITAYRNSLLDDKSESKLTSVDLSPEQRLQLEAHVDIANDIRRKGEQELYKQLIKQYQDYNQKKEAITKEFAEKRALLESATIDKAKDLIPEWDKLTAEQRSEAWNDYSEQVQSALTELAYQEQEAIKAVNDEEVARLQKSSSLLVRLFEDASNKGSKEIKKLYNEAKALYDYLTTTADSDIAPNFGMTAEQLKNLKGSAKEMETLGKNVKRLQDLSRGNNPFSTLVKDVKALFKKPDEKKGEDTESKIKNLGQSASETANLVGGFASKLAEMFEAAGNEEMAQAMRDVEMAMTSVSNIAAGFASGGIVGGIIATAGEAIGWATKAFEAEARYRKAMKEIMQELTAQQRQYNLALREQNLLMKQSDTIFGTLSYSKTKNAVEVLKDAWNALRKEIEGTNEQQSKYYSITRKVGQRGRTGKSKWVNPIIAQRRELKRANAGLADINIVTGFEKTGLFGWGKGRYIHSSILDVYPELIKANGEFNKELAKTIIATRSFKDEGKEALQHIIDLQEQWEKTLESIRDYLKGVFGELGNTLSDNLVEAFRNGTNAAENFEKSIGKMLENIGRQMVFSALFDGVIKKANEEMVKTMTNVKDTEEQKFNKYVEILDTMTSGILSQQGTYNELMKKYQQMAEKKGIKLFEPDQETRQASSKGIATASQDSVDELNGRATAIQGHTFSIAENTKLLVSNSNAILKSVMGIERNTNDIPTRLSNIESSVKSMKDTINDISIKGIKIK